MIDIIAQIDNLMGKEKNEPTKIKIIPTIAVTKPPISAREFRVISFWMYAFIFCVDAKEISS